MSRRYQIAVQNSGSFHFEGISQSDCQEITTVTSPAIKSPPPKVGKNKSQEGLESSSGESEKGSLESFKDAQLDINGGYPKTGFVYLLGWKIINADDSDKEVILTGICSTDQRDKVEVEVISKLLGSFSLISRNSNQNETQAY